jgi:hypothetical protein
MKSQIARKVIDGSSFINSPTSTTFTQALYVTRISYQLLKPWLNRYNLQPARPSIGWCDFHFSEQEATQVLLSATVFHLYVFDSHTVVRVKEPGRFAD